MKKTDPVNLLDFPCHYQFKAVGLAGEDFSRGIFAAISKHVDVSRDAVRSRPSGKGNYQAVSVLVTLYSYQQLTAIYAEMRQVRDLKMLL
ncbi:MAG: DUF493 domain-containing protein [Deltaproteobacteria bacterium]|jgi:hypothetical protein|nr:DUF493 domain-containing protein [Deltaproteobacteria bacterium]MCW9050396.1 DUF493 domain-containing protein [Deltaproteobacteria bacterium]